MYNQVLKILVVYFFRNAFSLSKPVSKVKISSEKKKQRQPKFENILIYQAQHEISYAEKKKNLLKICKGH